jgi:hypothetical protein
VTESRGQKAAFGKKRPIVQKARRGVNFGLRQIAKPARRGEVTGLVFYPPVRSDAELADLVARINWYLPGVDVPIHVLGAAGRTVSPEDAPHMDPPLVHTDRLSATAPTGPGVRFVLHRTTPGTVLGNLAKLRRTTVADALLSYTSEHGYRRLREALSTIPVPDARQSVETLLQRRVDGGTALVLGTGPSASELDDATIARADVRIICNSAVLNDELVDRLQPSAVCFGDPVFHYGPSTYAAQFRRDMLRTVMRTGALVVTPANFLQLLLGHHPELSDRVVGLANDGEDWQWPTPDRPQVKPSGNILTEMMLPVGLALADTVLIAGCDGRAKSENYFWKHNPAVQYDASLMGAVFEAHPSFFAARSYADYYDTHCERLQAFCVTAEAKGKSIEGVTRSYIPALRDRGAPAFTDAG